MNFLHTKNVFIRKAKKMLWPILDDKQTDILTFTMSTVYQILNNYGWFRLTEGLKEKPNCSIL